MNAGFSALAAGDVADAQYHFARTPSVDIHEQGRIFWPRTEDDTAWPFAPFPNVEQFFKADLVGGAWPRISIVTPSLNQGRYIEAAIASILNQNYPNLEYIVVDGGSTDETLAILERYRDRIDKVVVAELGQTAALNLGFEQLTGDLIGWLNTDDMLAPGALHAAAAAYSRSACDVIVGHCLVHREGEVERVLTPKRQRSHLETGALLDIFGKWLKRDFFCQPEVFVAREALQRIGGRRTPLFNTRWTMTCGCGWPRKAPACMSPDGRSPFSESTRLRRPATSSRAFWSSSMCRRNTPPQSPTRTGWLVPISSVPRDRCLSPT
ncbi:MAG: glycosyltransferase [Pseudomonadota bacterium]|nr:glycosyltransferase [Pseudomonadota bacterium]